MATPARHEIFKRYWLCFLCNDGVKKTSGHSVYLLRILGNTGRRLGYRALNPFPACQGVAKRRPIPETIKAAQVAEMADGTG